MIIKECMATCDFCGESFPDWKQDSSKLVRLQMKKNGWVNIQGKDMCDGCYSLVQNKEQPHD